MDISTLLSGTQPDPLSRQPIYLQIADVIGEHIENLVFPSGTKLPPERELAALFGVSRTTAINAYRHLEQRGMVLTKVGSGTYVADRPAGREDESLVVPWILNSREIITRIL